MNYEYVLTLPIKLFNVNYWQLYSIDEFAYHTNKTCFNLTRQPNVGVNVSQWSNVCNIQKENKRTIRQIYEISSQVWL